MRPLLARDWVSSQRDRLLDELSALLRIPSVSGPEPNPDIWRCGQALAAMLAALGAVDMDLRQYGPDPVLTARIPGPTGSPTVLVYGHFDVQPPDPVPEWTSPPFEPSVRDGRIYARGAGDNKGQLFAHLKAVEMYRALGLPLPASLLFLLDGGEETGSRGLAAMVRERPERLRADVAFAADGSRPVDDQPLVVLGTKGMIYVELQVQLLTKPVHSSHAPALPSAALSLTHLLAGLIGPGGEASIPGFYEAASSSAMDVPPLGHDLSSLLAPEASLRCDAGDAMRRMVTEPIVNISGLASGYCGPLSQVSLPSRAVARLDIALVPGQDPEQVFRCLEDRIEQLGHRRETARLLWAIEPSVTAPDNPYVTALTSAVRDAFGGEPGLLSSYPSYGPCALFTTRLGMPGVYAPYAASDENNHAPDENLRLEDLWSGITCSALAWARFAAVTRSGVR